MTRIATYVFIDLETTSLPSLEHNKTRITELSMVVVKRRHILETRPGASPRVQDKFTMCFNPQRMIDPGSTDTSGLCNDLLEYETAFNINVFNAINSFLQCLERPMCLIAQNGHSFDFPILKNHFEKLNVCLSDDILCADSLHAFHDIFENDVSKNVCKSDAATDSHDLTKSPCTAVVTNSVDNRLIDTNTNMSSNDQIDNQIADEMSENYIKLRPDCIKLCKDNDQILNALIEEQITPELLKDFYENEDLFSQNLIQQQNERTPQNIKQRLPKQTNRINKVKRKLYWGDKPKPEISYKLKDVYERVLRRPGVDAHRAENDCIMVMEVSVSIAKEFVEWVDKNHCAFAEVKPMRLGVPLGK